MKLPTLKTCIVIVSTLVLLVSLSACRRAAPPPAPDNSFSFSADPNRETVTFTPPAPGASARPASDTPVERALGSRELFLEHYSYQFLPENKLVFMMTFRNVTPDSEFVLPLYFTRNDQASNVLSSTEPDVTSADLGADSILSPGEATAPLRFEVTHNGQSISYSTVAHATVRRAGSASPLPQLWQQTTLGNGEGTASYDPELRRFNVNVFPNNTPTKHFTYQPLTRNATLTARVQGMTASSSDAKAGLMIRSSNDPSSPYALVALTPEGVRVEHSKGGGNPTYVSGSGVTGEVWLKLERKEDSVYVYESDDGVNWTRITTLTLGLSAATVIGLAVEATTAQAQGRFESVYLVQESGGGEGEIEGPCAYLFGAEDVPRNAEHCEFVNEGEIGPDGGRVMNEDGTVAILISPNLLKEKTLIKLDLRDERPPVEEVLQDVYPQELAIPVAQQLVITFPVSALDFESESRGIGVYIEVDPSKLTENPNIMTEVRMWYGDENVATLENNGDQGGGVVPGKRLLGFYGNVNVDTVEISFQPVDISPMRPSPDSSLLTPQAASPTNLEGFYHVPDTLGSDDIATIETDCGEEQQTFSLLEQASSASIDPDRTPLVLVHGWQVLGQLIDFSKTQYAPGLCEWLPFILNYIDTDSKSAALAKLREEYQLFTFSYDSYKSIYASAEKLDRALSPVFGTREIVLLGHSMGGIASGIYESQYSSHIKRIITVGTPQLGSAALWCIKAAADPKVGNKERCLEAQLNVDLANEIVNRTPFLSQLGKDFFREWLFYMSNKLSSDSGTQDLSWRFGGEEYDTALESCPLPGVCLKPLYTVDNPLVAKISSQLDYDRYTVSFGFNPDVPESIGFISAALLKAATGRESDMIVPVQSACISNQKNDCSSSPFKGNLIRREGFDHSEIKAENNEVITVELLRIAGALLDIDDGTPDGNQRLSIGNHLSLINSGGCPDVGGSENIPLKGDGVCDEALEEEFEIFTVPISFDDKPPQVVSGHMQRFGEDADANDRIGDGTVDMADFRRWRDWYIGQTAGSSLLSGSDSHPKKNMNGDLDTQVELCAAQQGNFENCIYPRWADFNGDGKVSMTNRMPVAGLGSQNVPQRNVDGTPLLTDLEVMMASGLWDDPIYNEQKIAGFKLEDYIDSFDVHIWPRTLLGRPDVERVESSIYKGTHTDGDANAKLLETLTHTEEEPQNVYTLPVSSEGYTGVIIAYTADGTVAVRRKAIFNMQSGQDRFWDPAGTVAVKKGNQHYTILLSDGTVWSTGKNHYGQLGVSGIDESTTPVQVAIEGVVDVAVENFTVAALKSDGSVWTWGVNSGGQLGNGSPLRVGSPPQWFFSARPVKVPVADITTIDLIYPGGFQALSRGGGLFGWGYNEGKDENSGGNKYVTSPKQTPIPGPVVDISGFGNNHALTTSGQIWWWSSWQDSPGPYLVRGSDTVASIDSGVVLDRDGTVWMLEEDTDTTPYSYFMKQVPGLIDVITIQGGYHRVALKRDGTVWMWGGNFEGRQQCGATSSQELTTEIPALVPNRKDITEISADFYHTILTGPGGKQELCGAHEFWLSYMLGH